MNRATSSPSDVGGARDIGYDFTKGFLVEVMILFHSIQYFVGIRELGLNYLDFVTGGFVLLAGAAVTQFYAGKYSQQRSIIMQRLFIRGAKLVLLFAALNIGIQLLVRRNYNGVEFGVVHFLDHGLEVFGGGSKRLSCFEILLPIGYALILAGALVSLIRSTAGQVLVIGALVALACLWTSAPFNLRFTAIGLSGVLVGHLRRMELSPRAHRVTQVVLLLLVAGYELSINWLEEDNLWYYLIGVVSVVQLVSLSAAGLNPDTRLVKTIVLFGRYSLFSYLFQILFLQVLLRTCGDGLLGQTWAVFPILATNAVLYLLLVALDSLRARHAFINSSYRLMFA